MKQSKLNDFHDHSNNQENSIHLCTPTFKDEPKNLESNSIIVFNSNFSQSFKSLKSSFEYEYNDSKDSQARDRKELPSSSASDPILKRSINDKKLCRNQIKSCVKTTFKLLKRNFNIKMNNNASKTIESSREAQRWADIRMLPKNNQICS